MIRYQLVPLKLKAPADFALNTTDEPYTQPHVLSVYPASSVPTISSRHEMEVFGESVLYANASTVEELAEKVRFLANNADARAGYRARIDQQHLAPIETPCPTSHARDESSFADMP